MQNILNDSIVRIQNGQKLYFSEIELRSSKIVIDFLKFLYDEGFIRGFEKKQRNIKVYLKYCNGKPVISLIKTISTKNKRVYMTYSDILKVYSFKEIFVLLTPKGFCSNKDLLNTNNLGGEVICKIF